MGSILDIVVPVGLCIIAIVAAAIVYSIVVAVKGRKAAKREETAWREQHAAARKRVPDNGKRR